MQMLCSQQREENLGKFDPRSNEGAFVEFSVHSKAYMVYNNRLNKIDESVHVTFDENVVVGDQVLDKTITLEDTAPERLTPVIPETHDELLEPRELRLTKTKSGHIIINDQSWKKDFHCFTSHEHVSDHSNTPSKLSLCCVSASFASPAEPQTVKDVLKYPDWVNAMQ